MNKDVELIRDCKLQLEYLNEKFEATGTTNALLAKINRRLDEHDRENQINNRKEQDV